MFSRPERIHPSAADVAVEEFLRTYRSVNARVAFHAAARHIYLEEPKGPKRLLHPAAGARAAGDVRLGRRGPARPARLLPRYVRDALPTARAGRARAVRARPAGRAPGRRERAGPRLHRARPGVGGRARREAARPGRPPPAGADQRQRPERRTRNETAAELTADAADAAASRSRRPRIRAMAESGAGTAAHAQERAEPATEADPRAARAPAGSADPRCCAASSTRSRAG